MQNAGIIHKCGRNMQPKPDAKAKNQHSKDNVKKQ
jgi:hypothetical protein